VISRMFSRLAGFILLAVLGLCGCGPTAQLRGKVADGFGEPLKAVQVSIATTDLKTATGSDGEFKLRYIPGKFVVNFRKDGYTGASLNQEVATETQVPLQRVVLYKLPSAPGIWLFAEHDYVGLGQGKLTITGGDLSKFAWVYDKAFYVSGNFTKLPRTESYRFADNMPQAMALIRLAGPNLLGLRREAFNGVGNSAFLFIGEKSENVGGLLVRTVSLKSGRYAYAQIPRSIVGFNLPPAEPVFLFEVE
jgi:hypothetical protein